MACIAHSAMHMQVLLCRDHVEACLIKRFCHHCHAHQTQQCCKLKPDCLCLPLIGHDTILLKQSTQYVKKGAPHLLDNCAEALEMFRSPCKRVRDPRSHAGPNSLADDADVLAGQRAAAQAARLGQPLREVRHLPQ